MKKTLLRLALGLDPTVTTIATGFPTNLEVSNQGRKLVRASNGDLYTTYFKPEGNVYKIFLAKSSDKGKNWQEIPVTPEATTYQINPSLAIDSKDNLHIVWQGKDISGFYQIRYRKYNGAFDQIENLTNNENWHQRIPVIGVDSQDNLHLVWVNNQKIESGYPGNWVWSLEILHRTFTNQWGEIERAGNPYDALINSLALAIDSQDYLHLVWQGEVRSGYSSDSVIQYQKRTDYWREVKQLDKDEIQGKSVSIAVDSQDNLHIVWHSLSGRTDRVSKINYLKYTASSVSWGAIEILDQNDRYNYVVTYPSISVDSQDYLYVIWKRWQYDKIYQVKYTDSWQAVETFDSPGSQGFLNLLWQPHPVVAGKKTNQPKTGQAFIYYEGSDLKYYASSDLTWE